MNRFLTGRTGSTGDVVIIGKTFMSKRLTDTNGDLLISLWYLFIPVDAGVNVNSLIVHTCKYTISDLLEVQQLCQQDVFLGEGRCTKDLSTPKDVGVIWTFRKFEKH